MPWNVRFTGPYGHSSPQRLNGSWSETFIQSETNRTSEARQAAIETDKFVNLYIEPKQCWINGTEYKDHTFVNDPVEQDPEYIH